MARREDRRNLARREAAVGRAFPHEDGVARAEGRVGRLVLVVHQQDGLAGVRILQGDAARRSRSVDRAALDSRLGEDGVSQMSIEDIALTAVIPYFTVVVPADEVSSVSLIRGIYEVPGPAFARTGRNKVPRIYEAGDKDFTIGKARVVREGTDLLLRRSSPDSDVSRFTNDA